MHPILVFISSICFCFLSMFKYLFWLSAIQIKMDVLYSLRFPFLHWAGQEWEEKILTVIENTSNTQKAAFSTTESEPKFDIPGGKMVNKTASLIVNSSYLMFLIKKWIEHPSTEIWRAKRINSTQFDLLFFL